MTGVPATRAGRYSRSVDLDVDIGADAVDYNAIAKQGKSSFTFIIFLLLILITNHIWKNRISLRPRSGDAKA